MLLGSTPTFAKNIEIHLAHGHCVRYSDCFVSAVGQASYALGCTLTVKRCVLPALYASFVCCLFACKKRFLGQARMSYMVLMVEILQITMETSRSWCNLSDKLKPLKSISYYSIKWF